MNSFRNLYLTQILKTKTIKNSVITLIKQNGAQSVSRIMNTCLSDRNQGYYIKNDVIGVKGDFVTSPEISQMFGELLGLWIVNEWSVQGEHKPLQLVELGPGRGSLMSDVIKAISKFPNLVKNIRVSFVEISPALKIIQENTMKNCKDTVGLDIHFEWFEDLQNVPRGINSAYIANEFFDALPIHKFKRNSSGKWREVLVDLIKTKSDDIELGFVVSNIDTAATLAFADILDGVSLLNDYEICPYASTIIEVIGQRLLESKGFGLIVDYGHCGDRGDTFRAFKSHRVTHPLKDLGDSDLTADVNFKFLLDRLTIRFSDQLIIGGPISQHHFLKNMGIDLRLQMLLHGCKTKVEIDNLISGYKIMMNADEMGERFKFLAMLPKSEANPKNYVPAGFCLL